MSSRIPSSRIIGLSLALIAMSLFSASLQAAHPFVNDFEAYDLSQSEQNKFRDLVIADSDRVTVFFKRGQDVGSEYRIYRLYSQVFDGHGRVLHPSTPFREYQDCSAVDWIQVGSSNSGRWATANHLLQFEPGQRTSAAGLFIWISNGTELDTAFAVGAQIRPLEANHWGAVGIDSTGRLAVAWVNSREPDGSDVWLQLFDRDGAARTDTLRLSGRVTPEGMELRDQRNTRMAMADDGSFVIVWQAFCDSCPPTPWTQQVFFRSYAADATPLSPVECASCSGDPTDFWNLGGASPAVAMLPGGEFVLAWRQYRYDCGIKIMMRRFHPGGLPDGDLMIVDSGLCHQEIAPSVAADKVGNVLVAWQDDSGEQDQLSNLMVQRFDSSGSRVGRQFQINDGFRNVLYLSVRAALNFRGLAGFLWAEWSDLAGDRAPRQHDMMQLMDLQDVGVYLRGDANNDRRIDLHDAECLVNFVLQAGPPPKSPPDSDLTGDGVIDLADTVRLISCLNKVAPGERNCLQSP